VHAPPSPLSPQWPPLPCLPVLLSFPLQFSAFEMGCQALTLCRQILPHVRPTRPLPLAFGLCRTRSGTSLVGFSALTVLQAKMVKGLLLLHREWAPQAPGGTPR